MWLNITDFLTPLKNIIIMSKVIIKAKKSGGLSSEFQNCNDSREVKLEIAPLDIISKQAVGKKATNYIISISRKKNNFFSREIEIEIHEKKICFVVKLKFTKIYFSFFVKLNSRLYILTG